MPRCAVACGRMSKGGAASYFAPEIFGARPAISGAFINYERGQSVLPVSAPLSVTTTTLPRLPHTQRTCCYPARMPPLSQLHVAHLVWLRSEMNGLDGTVADVWSLGRVLLNLLSSSREPLDGARQLKAQQFALSTPLALQRLVDSMLCTDASQRWTAKECCGAAALTYDFHRQMSLLIVSKDNETTAKDKEIQVRCEVSTCTHS